MVVNGRPLKRMKRRVTADLSDFHTFPVTGEGFSGELDGPFRSNIRSFLSKYAMLPHPSSIFSSSAVPHMLTWQIVFRIGDIGEQGPSASVVTLDVVEEDVTRSRSVYCDQCRVVGWSGHPVCGKRYHFIIRAEGRSVDDGYPRSCPRCRDLQHSLDLRCKSCNYETTVDDLEDWAYLQLEDSTHLLHGLVHTNGYGHLLRVNGREGGSKFLSGCDIMDFWDRLCKALRVRKVSVMDVSKKYGLEYRLLHAVTTGRPWYGDWGYEFGAGSFALTADAYRKAVDTLSNMPLTLFFYHMRSSSSRTRLQDVVALYWSLSERQLVTVRDLVRFVIGLLHDAHKQVAGCAIEKSSSAALCPWTRDDIERVEHAMIRVLQVAGNRSCWVTLRALKGAMCHSASPELLDYCLKELGGKSNKDGGVVVCSRYNPETNAIEYRLDADSKVSDPSAAFVSSTCPSEENLLRDLKFLYASLLHPETMISYKPQAKRELSLSSAAKLLDCKQFVKDYEIDQMVLANPFGIKITCQVELVEQPKDYTAPPPELLLLPADATVSDLKLEATKAFQEVYVLFKRFHAEQLLDFGDVVDATRVKFLLGSSASVRVRGKCVGNYHGLQQFRMERGTESWTVECKCGARDDDGERMLACDACGVWQHTRCAGIRDIDIVPTRFACERCATGTSCKNKSTASRRICKDELVVGVGGFDCLTMPFGVR